MILSIGICGNMYVHCTSTIYMCQGCFKTNAKYVFNTKTFILPFIPDFQTQIEVRFGMVNIINVHLRLKILSQKT